MASFSDGPSCAAAFRLLIKDVSVRVSRPCHEFSTTSKESCYRRSRKLSKSPIAQISASAISTFAAGSNSTATLRTGPAPTIRGVDCSLECTNDHRHWSRPGRLRAITRPFSIQVKTNLKAKPSGGRGKPALDWWISETTPAELIALADLDSNKIWILLREELGTVAQQKSSGRFHIYMLPQDSNA